MCNADSRNSPRNPTPTLSSHNYAHLSPHQLGQCTTSTAPPPHDWHSFEMRCQQEATAPARSHMHTLVCRPAPKQTFGPNSPYIFTARGCRAATAPLPAKQCRQQAKQQAKQACRPPDPSRLFLPCPACKRTRSCLCQGSPAGIQPLLPSTIKPDALGAAVGVLLLL